MANISRVSLFGKLNKTAYKTIESATVFCKLRGNPYVELVHWIYQIANLSDSDFHRIIKYYDIDISKVSKDLLDNLESLRTGATSVSDFSPHIEDSVERAWVYASLLYSAAAIRTGYLLIGILKTKSLKSILLGISREFSKIDVEDLCEKIDKLTEGSPEKSSMPGLSSGSLAGQQVGADDSPHPSLMGAKQALSMYAVNLTQKAKDGQVDPVVGRDSEIRQMINILLRRRQNNPILTGEAGVGKTAVVEGLALRIANSQVPKSLADVEIWALDIGLLQAGASMKGEFEKRLRQVIYDVQASPKPIILFVDEAHTLIGAGGSAGTGDAANLLKPALARGTLRTIAATTWSEYKKYIEKDPALTRRFQVVKVDEPSEAQAINMLRNVASCLEKHHNAYILDEAIVAAVKLSKRYIPSRQLPDKAISLLDTACSRVVVSQDAKPPQMESLKAELEAFEVERNLVEQEISIGLDRCGRKDEILNEIDRCGKELQEIQCLWEKEQEIVGQIVSLRKKLVSGSVKEAEIRADMDDSGQKPYETTDELYSKLIGLQKELAEYQKDNPLVLPAVDVSAVSTVVADWTGIPVGRMVKNEVESVLRLSETLRKRVVGQDHALEAIAKRIRTSRAGVENPNKPVGVMFLVGSSGVGKTETALALAEALYGGEESLITINMSEFQEAHTVSTLKGSPPGYVGYGEGGVLTEAVRRKPYSIVLLDEVEKAHPDVHEIFFQVFDKGHMEDAEGRDIDFRNTIILLTSNVGTDMVMNMCKDPELMPDPEGLAKAMRAPLLEVFPPALLGRMSIVPYYPINDNNLKAIVRLQLNRISARIKANHNIPFEYADEVVDIIVSRCNEIDSGARLVDSILTNSVLPAISDELLMRIVNGASVSKIGLSVKSGDFHYIFD